MCVESSSAKMNSLCDEALLLREDIVRLRWVITYVPVYQYLVQLNRNNEVDWAVVQMPEIGICLAAIGSR